jgi:hypothetical protein
VPTRSVLLALLALYAVYMLARYAPRAVRLARDPEHRAGALVPLVNVVLALAILAMVVTRLAGALISR